MMSRPSIVAYVLAAAAITVAALIATFWFQ
jgi:hypothetical protein